MSSHKSELRITVVEDLDWPTLEEGTILTSNSLWPQDVTDGGDVTGSRYTPSGLSAKFAWPDAPTSSHTLAFPSSPLLSTSRLPLGRQTPLEKHKRRLRRYHAAESRLLAGAGPPSPALYELHTGAVHYARRSLAAHIIGARLCLRDIRLAGRRDGARWLAEHRLAALEALHPKLAKAPTPPFSASVSDGDSLHKHKANLVRFLAARRGDALVPVFTRARARLPAPAGLEAEAARRCMTAGSPMRLQAGPALSKALAGAAARTWEARVRAVLLHPHPRPKRQAPPRIVTAAPRLSASTTGSHSSSEVETPLTELEDDEEEEAEEVVPPKHPVRSSDPPRVRSSEPPRVRSSDSPRWHRSSGPISPPRSPPKPPSRLPPVPPHPTQRTPLLATPRSSLPPLPPHPPPRASLPLPPHPPPRASLPLPPTPAPEPAYTWLADPSTWARESAWRGDGWEVVSPTLSLASTPSPSVSTDTTPPYTPIPTPTPQRNTAERPQTLPPAHRFWPRLGPIAEAAGSAKPASPKVKPLPLPPAPLRPLPTPPPQKKAGLHLFSALRPNKGQRGSIPTSRD